MDHFLPFYHPKNLINQNFETLKKTPGDIIILHMCTMTTIWYMAPEILSQTHPQRILHWGWGWYWVWWTDFFLSLWTIFALLPHKNPINQNFEKMTKTHGDIIISYMCTINDNHMIFGSWDIECNRQIVLSFWMVFCPFPPTTLKIKISEKWKNHLKIPSFYKSVPKIMIIWYTVREIWHVMDIIVIFHFGLIFALLTP